MPVPVIVPPPFPPFVTVSSGVALAGISASVPLALSLRPLTVTPLMDGMGSPPLSSALFTVATETELFFAHASAATPATCGVAIEVPWIDSYELAS